MTLDEANAACHAAFRHASILDQADAFEVAADAYEEAGALLAAGSVRVWADTCRRAYGKIWWKNPRAVRIGNGMGLVHDEMAPGVTHEMGPPGDVDDALDELAALRKVAEVARKISLGHDGDLPVIVGLANLANALAALPSPSSSPAREAKT